MDFTLKIYRKLLTTLKEGGFGFQTFEKFLEEPGERVVVLRHDVDLRQEYAHVMAQLEREIGISGTYFFRVVRGSYNVDVIRKIHGLEHEVGYHYETMDIAGRSIGRKGDYNKSDEHWERVIVAAWEEFKVNLHRLREIVPVRTAAMHGSPRSRFNNLDLWKRYDYKELGIIGEPYLDVDFSDVLYLTDTGRRWDGAAVSVRDRVDSGGAFEGLSFSHTRQIIEAARNGDLPPRIMINVHPQRWTNKPMPWIRELVWQNIKNQVKRFLVKR